MRSASCSWRVEAWGREGRSEKSDDSEFPGGAELRVERGQEAMKAMAGWTRRSFVTSVGAAVAAVFGGKKLHAAEGGTQNTGYGSESVTARPR